MEEDSLAEPGSPEEDTQAEADIPAAGTRPSDTPPVDNLFHRNQNKPYSVQTTADRAIGLRSKREHGLGPPIRSSKPQ